VVAVNPFPSNKINQYRYQCGQFPLAMGTFHLSGEDVFSFLQKQTTIDMSSFGLGEFRLTTFLDPQGRIETYGWILNQGQSYLYLVPEELLEATKERLERFLISEDVTIEERLIEPWWVVLGPKAKVEGLSFAGQMFGENAFFIPHRPVPLVSVIPDEVVNVWRTLNGWPDFTGKNFVKEIINNTRLFDLVVTMNKGCYPGQETVSKIATRRGAAYAPVLIETVLQLPAGEISNFENKIGTIISSHSLDEKFYSAANLLRDFRVDQLKISFSMSGQSFNGLVRYYPLFSSDPRIKAEELFHEASEHFKFDRLNQAESCFRLSIELDPTFADSYEGLGVMLGRQERFDEAVKIMEQLEKVDPSSVLAHTNLSLFLMRLGRIEEAEDHKSKATVRSFEKFGELSREKSALEEEQKRRQDEWLKREYMFRQVLEIDDSDALANYGLGSIAVERQDWAQAKTHLEKVIACDPKYSVAYLALGKAYAGLKQFSQAREVWQQGVKIAANKGDLMPANQMQSELELIKQYP